MDRISSLFRKTPEKTRFQLFEEREAREAARNAEKIEKSTDKNVGISIRRILIMLHNGVKVWIPYDMTRTLINKYDFTGKDCIIKMEQDEIII